MPDLPDFGSPLIWTFHTESVHVSYEGLAHHAKTNRELPCVLLWFPCQRDVQAIAPRTLDEYFANANVDRIPNLND